MLSVVAERNHQSVLQVPLCLQVLQEGSDCAVDESHRPSEVLVPLDQVDLRQLGAAHVLIEEASSILKGVLRLGVVVEAAVSSCRVTFGEAELEVRLVEVGVAVEGKGLVVGRGIDDCLNIAVIYVSSVGSAETCGKAGHESSITELLVETVRSSCSVAVVKDLVHFISGMTVEHRENVVGGVVAHGVIFVELVSLGLYLRKGRRLWLSGRVASLPGLLLEPAHELGQLDVRLKAAHRVQEYHQYVLDQGGRGGGRELAKRLSLFLSEGAVVDDIDVVSLLNCVEDDVVLLGLLGLFDGLVALGRLEHRLDDVSVRPLHFARVFEVREANNGAVCEIEGKVLVEYLAILLAQEAVVDEVVEVEAGNGLEVGAHGNV